MEIWQEDLGEFGRRSSVATVNNEDMMSTTRTDQHSYEWDKASEKSIRGDENGLRA